MTERDSTESRSDGSKVSDVCSSDSDSRSDSRPAPPDWYVDPEDSEQYRFWDGSAWTEHRSPRYIDDEDYELEPPGRLVVDTVLTIRRRWPGYMAVILCTFAGGIASASLLELGYGNHPDGDFTTQINRMVQDLWTRTVAPETETSATVEDGDAQTADTDTGAEEFHGMDIHWTLIAALIVTIATESTSVGSSDALDVGRQAGPSRAIRRTIKENNGTIWNFWC